MGMAFADLLEEATDEEVMIGAGTKCHSGPEPESFKAVLIPVSTKKIIPVPPRMRSQK